jgi:hypothetical protein
MLPSIIPIDTDPALNRSSSDEDPHTDVHDRGRRLVLVAFAKREWIARNALADLIVVSNA